MSENDPNKLSAEICSIVGDHLLRDDVTPESNFTSLECDELDMYAICMLIDEKFDISLPTEFTCSTVSDLVRLTQEELLKGAA